MEFKVGGEDGGGGWESYRDWLGRQLRGHFHAAR